MNHALRIAVEAGLVASNNDARRLLELLNHTVQPRWCVVAYLDYVGASPNFRWQKFLALWRVLAKEANDWGFTGYYWRSSDSFYFFRSLADGEGADEKEPVCESFLKFLLYIQAKRCIPGDRWMWEIGVSLEKGTLVGDIFLPNGAPKAAKAMDVASDKLRGGGAIVATKKFRNSLSRISKRKMKALRGDNRELFYYDRLGVND
ncbi:MAG TPA: hypothetical protein VN937_28540 [Blastocatellia bacterium]|nr:hypothetical protein [Blastocatellia bacterium]